ncbi:cytochrome P450 [Planomonospora parontospora]|uniref:cytochrome P450 n=1 Tax=Planomonospora parontospora TaxID=58119 RepID=UPI00166F7833|nr:cytochrome P450 [Planomonospora parontospora]GGL54860.1 cytochrome P450 [Planomonospora parontospora subsp. antibiotica]GII19283.1 cytochrome P450 [Planomonospora parontospora subsp. antibiotica]
MNRDTPARTVCGASGPSAATPAAVPYPFSDRHTFDLEPPYADLQRSDQLHRVQLPHGGPAWLAVRYDHVRQILADPRFSRAHANRADIPRLSSEVLPATSMMALDPPEHTRIRRALAPHFTADRIEHLRPRATAGAEELLETMAAAGRPADLLAHLAIPFPLLMICELLGMSAREREHFTDFASALRSARLPPAARQAARHRFETFVADHLLTPGVHTPDGLLAALRRDRDEQTLSTAEIVDVVIALLVGGVGSPSTLLASGVCLLLRRPDLVAWLTADPGRVPAAAEELLRLVPVGVAGGFVRVATQDITVGATLVHAGEAVLPAMTAANRDPAAFPDPLTLRPDRPATPRHLGLGHGAHHCVGAHLARVELQVALTALFARMPALRLAVDESDLHWHEGLVVRELKELPVSW